MLRKIGNFLVKRSSWYCHDVWRGARKFIDLERINELDFVNTGSTSGACAFDYGACGVNGFNFALGPQSLHVDLKLIKAWRDRLKVGTVVFVPLCPFSGLESKYDSHFWFRYYPLLPQSEIEGFDEMTAKGASRLWVDPLGWSRELCFYGICRSLRARLRRILRGGQKKMDMAESANAYISGWKRQFGIVDLEQPVSQARIGEFKIRGAALRALLEFCMGMKWRPVLVFPPMHSALGTRLSLVFRENYIGRLLNEVVDLAVPYWDYSDWSELRDDSYYANALLLNKRGAAVFTREVVRRAGL